MEKIQLNENSLQQPQRQSSIGILILLTPYKMGRIYGQYW
jgi:hypothetical protein